ncbi:MAG: PKD domain-containing protein, partial [Opitutales bacterium]|nr:PKD domain-containing protein [Opitutales bacterium]
MATLALLPRALFAEEAETNPFTVAVNTYLGGTGDHDAVTSAEIQSDGTIVLTAIIGNANPGGVAPTLVNGATAASAAAILRLSSDGQTVLSVTRTGDELWDVSLDAADNIYVAGGYDGLLKLNPTADTVLFQRKAGTFIARVDAGRNGDVAILAPIHYGYNAVDGRRIEHNNAGASWIHAYDANGDLITEFQTLGGRNNVDVAIWDGDGNRDDARIVYIGWRQAWAYVGAIGGGCGDPFVRATQGLNVTVHIGLMYGVTYDYDGTNPEEVAYRIYDRPARPDDVWLPEAPADLKLRRQEHINPRFFNGPVNVSELYTLADIDAARTDGEVWNDWLWLEYDAGNSYVGAAKNIIYPEAHAWYMQGIPGHPDFLDEAFRRPGWCDNFTSTNLIGLPYITGGNNMADTRGQRVAIGRDGKLYALWESAGGNTEVRWNPFDITQAVPSPDAGLYHQFLNIASSHAITFLRYEPVTGEALLRQEFAPNFVNNIGQTISNTVRAKGADITADESGRVFVTGAAAGEMPIPLADNYSGVTGFNPYPDGSYMGGAYLLVMSPDFSRREYATRLTPNGWGHAVAARVLGDPAVNTPIIVYGGREDLVEPLWLKNALQPFPGYGMQDGFFAVFGGEELGADQYQAGWGLNNRTLAGRHKYRGTDPVSSAIDADGGGTANDAVSGWPFSDTVPLSPSAPTYTGMPYYGGMEAIRLNVAPGNFWNMSRTGPNGNFHAETGEWLRDMLGINPTNVYRSTSLIYFDKKDFPGVNADDRLSFSSATRQRVSYVTDRAWLNARWVVRDGDTFYVSEAMAIEDRNRANSGGLSFGNDFDHGRWAVYDPATRLYFDADEAVFISRTFTDITGFGVINNLISSTGSNNAGIWGELRNLTMQFEVNHVASRPPTAVIQQSHTYLHPNQFVLLDGSNSTDPDGTVSFFAWEQRNNSNTRVAGPVVSFSYTAPGNYKPLLRVFDDQIQSAETSTRLWVGPDPALGVDPDRVVAAYAGVKGVTNLRGRTFTQGGLDLNGNGVFNDTRAGAVFSETDPVENRIGSTNLYGGMIVQFFDGSNPIINRWEWRERFWVEFQSRPANIHGALFIDKTDFLNEGEFGTVAFGAGDYVQIRVAANATNWPLRWLVREGGQYYVSQATFSAGSTNHRYTFSGANDGMWALYDPAADLNFDAASATFAPMTFNDVTALGLVIDSDTISTAFQRLQIDHIVAEATITPPASTPPVPSFTWTPTTPDAGQTVTFDASASTDALAITGVRWEFEGGGFQQFTGTAANPPVLTAPTVFAAPGAHNVTLILTNELGLSAALTQEITVAGDPVTRARVSATPTSGIVPLSVVFDASASTAATGASIVRYDWNFGDGTVLADGGATPGHTYTATGTYNATVTITDSAGSVSTASLSVSVAAAPTAQPTASFTFTPSTGKNPLTVSLDASASTAGSGEIVNYIWNFSDGTTASGETVEKIFADPGTFTIFLSVLNSFGKVDSTQADIVVIENLHPVAALSVSANEGTVPLTVHFDASASFDPDGTIVRYDWDFGDGTTLLDGGPTQSHIYGADGTFTATVTVTDDNGATAQATQLITAVEIGAAQLVYHYIFDGGSGTTVADVSGFGDAAAAAMLVWDDPADLYAAAIPSPQGLDYADFAAAQRRHMTFASSKWNSSISGSEGTGAFTVTMLLRDLNPNSAGSNTDRAFFKAGGNNFGLFHGASTNASALPLIVRVNSTTDVPLSANANLSNATTGDSNGWILLSLTYNAFTNTARVYVGREFDADSGVWTQLDQVGNDLTINATTLNNAAGLQFGTSSSRSPRALYDDFRIYDRALLPVEIASLLAASSEGEPVILTQPESQVAVQGDTVTFEVAALGSPEPAYQWYFEGDPLPGETAATLTLINVSPADEGTYFVRVSNSFGHVDSDPATLSVILPPPAPSGLVSTFVAPTSVGLSWTDNSGGEAGFEVRLADGTVVATTGPGETSATIGDLIPDTSYTFTVRAVNMAGASGDSNALPVRTDFVVTHTVSFSANGGSGPVPSPETVVLGEPFTVPGPGDLTKAGHAFNGWRDNL